MEILRREKEIVKGYQYFTRDPIVEKVNGQPHTSNQVTIGILEKNAETKLLVKFEVIIVFEEFFIQGNFEQIIYCNGIETDEFTSDEVMKLANPLFDLFNRLNYDVTEIALDEPGITVEIKI